ncbi:MAG: class I SAM-dependent methyltransferase [Sphingomonadales bacterium]
MRFFSTLALASSLLIAAPVAVHAAPANIPANIPAAVAAKNRPADQVKLDESRKPIPVLQFLGLKRGDRALDLFTAAGYYADIMGHAVGPKGTVIGLQPSFFFNDDMKKSWDVVSASLPNTHLLLTSMPTLGLAPNSFDFVMIHLNYHDLYGAPTPPTTAADLFAAVKPGGIVGVVDHAGAAGLDLRDGATKLHRIDPAVVRADFEKAGFVFDGESDVLRNPDDDHSKVVFDPAIRGKTDRFVYRFKKPA